MQRNLCALSCWLWLISFSCTPAYTRFMNEPALFNNRTPDYNDMRLWAAHPSKKDASDSLPNTIVPAITGDTLADVFFIHPTTFTRNNDTGWNASLTDDTLNLKTDNSTILYQASAFNQYRLFAPRYRQAHLRSYYTLDTQRAAKAFDLAYEDVKNAFEHFLLQNNNRPIVLASHSQGSTHAIRLLNEYFQEGSLRDRLVAAYILGMNIPSAGNLSACVDSLATGCVCAWRTFRQGYIPSYISDERGEKIITNPLTWTTDDNLASRMLNKGALIRDFTKISKHAADAKIQDRVLWVSQLRFPGSVFVRQKNLHIGDINLFYMNIRENVKTRVQQWHSNANSDPAK